MEAVFHKSPTRDRRRDEPATIVAATRQEMIATRSCNRAIVTDEWSQRRADFQSLATRCDAYIIFAILFGIVSANFVTGCDASSEASINAGRQAEPAIYEVDAGVIFGDRESYLVFPLSRFELESSAAVESLTSSCECVNPSFVQYADGATADGDGDGLLIEFVPEEPTFNPAPQSVRLAVEVKLTMNDADSRVIRVTFLRTTRSAF